MVQLKYWDVQYLPAEGGWYPTQSCEALLSNLNVLHPGLCSDCHKQQVKYGITSWYQWDKDGTYKYENIVIKT